MIFKNNILDILENNFLNIENNIKELQLKNIEYTKKLITKLIEADEKTKKHSIHFP